MAFDEDNGRFDCAFVCIMAALEFIVGVLIFLTLTYK